MNNIRVWNPWDMQDPFNKMMQNMHKNLPPISEEDFSTQINLVETDSAYEVEVLVPKMKSEDIDLSIEDRYLTISAESCDETEDKKYHIKEIFTISFARTIVLPGHVDQDKIEAKVEHGILKVTLHKITKGNPKKITVK